MLNTDSKPVEHTMMIWPVVIRLGLFVTVPIVEFVFHRLAHFGIHHSIEKVEWLKQIAKRFKYFPDVLMIGALVVLHYVSE